MLQTVRLMNLGIFRQAALQNVYQVGGKLNRMVIFYI